MRLCDMVFLEAAFGNKEDVNKEKVIHNHAAIMNDPVSRWEVLETHHFPMKSQNGSNTFWTRHVIICNRKRRKHKGVFLR